MTLCAQGLYVKATGGTSHLFLPLPVYSVTAVVESGAAVTAAGYWVQVGQPWLVRKRCSCASDCTHPRGRWLATYPDNVSVIYKPLWWNTPPMLCGSVMMEAFGAQRELTGLSSESFLSYSYSRSGSPAQRWDEILTRAGLRQYQIQAVIG